MRLRGRASGDIAMQVPFAPIPHPDPERELRVLPGVDDARPLPLDFCRAITGGIRYSS
jgi:hypothetical protein